MIVYGKANRRVAEQSDYDMDTADFMHGGGRHIYAVFMCHRSIEKALKGLYYEKLRKFPPKSHNLVYLLNEIGIKPPEKPGKFIVKMSEASIPLRYPENLAKIQHSTMRSWLKTFLPRVRRSLYGQRAAIEYG